MELVSSFQIPTWKRHVQIPPPSSPKKTTAFLRKRSGPLQLQPDLWSHRHPSNGCRVADVFPAPICTFLDEIPVAQKLHFVVPGIVCALQRSTLNKSWSKSSKGTQKWRHLHLWAMIFYWLTG
jgi:hypothetical protein